MHRIRNAYRAKSIPKCRARRTKEERCLDGIAAPSVASTPKTSRRNQPRGSFPRLPAYNSSMSIPGTIQGRQYMSLISFRKNGTAVPTPVWFSEKDDKLYVMTRSDSGKYKRITEQSPGPDRSLHHARQDHRTRSSRPPPGSFLPKTGPGPAKPSSKNIGSPASLPSGANRTSIWKSKFQTEHRQHERSVRFAICRILRFPVTIFFPLTGR